MIQYPTLIPKDSQILKAASMPGDKITNLAKLMFIEWLAFHKIPGVFRPSGNPDFKVNNRSFNISCSQISDLPKDPPPPNVKATFFAAYWPETNMMFFLGSSSFPADEFLEKVLQNK